MRERYNFPVHTVPTHILSHFYALGPSGETFLRIKVNLEEPVRVDGQHNQD